MRAFRMFWAGTTGWLIDSILTQFIGTGAMWMVGVEQYTDWNFSNPVHILAGLIIPVLMTVVGGGVAGALAPLDAAPAGALVGGLGLVFMALTSVDQLGLGNNALVALVGQCVAVVLAAGAAHVVARRRRIPV